MKKVLFTALDTNGKNQTDYIEVHSNKQAIERLKEKGFTDIKLYSDATIDPIKNEILDDMPKWQLKKMAEFELKNQTGHSIISTLLQTVIMNSWLIIIGLIIVLFGYFQNRPMTVFFGGFFIVITPLISLWRQRHVKRFNRIISLFTYGQWDKALKEIKIHRKFKEFPDLEHDLDFREAAIHAKKGNLQKGLDLVKKWTSSFELSNPGYFESRLATIYHAADDENKAMELIRIYHEKTNSPDFAALDLAMLEALSGNSDKALSLIEKIDLKSLPVIAHTYPIWIKGVLSMEKNENIQAKNYLESTLENLLKRKGQPLIEISIAECSAQLAIVYHRLGKIQEASQLLKNISSVLNAHGSKKLLDKVENISPRSHVLRGNA